MRMVGVLEAFCGSYNPEGPSTNTLGTLGIYRKCEYPKGPHTAHLRPLPPKAIPGIVFGTRVLKWAVY